VRALAADFAGQSASMPSLAVTAVERRMAGQRGNPLAIAASEAVKASPGR
jgi:hypothetical protein